ncbi:YadA family autotransporter adhesin [Paraburkholderia tropica]|uniref:YadA family autotransporter adhesin n=1 Tax=Paraburkholderia tropica TaxID=92647 RepID=UPI002AB72262|nr:YadA-like family protein [Paraburkholderia tropica]
MNKTYRSIWNETTGTWVAVQEDAAARGKRSSKAVIAGASGIVGVLNVIGVMGGAALATSAHADTVADNSAARVVAVGTDSVASLDNAAVAYGTGSYADSGLGLLPGVAVGSQADGMQGAFAVNLGQVAPVVGAAPVASGSGGVQMLAMNSAPLLGASLASSGIDTGDLNTSFKTAAWYTQIKGIANAAGSAAPTDAARVVGLGSIAMGSNTQSDGNGSMALGTQSYAKANDSVALGTGSVSTQANTVSVGSDGTATHVVYNADGVATTLQSTANTYNNVGGALTNIDSRVTTLETTVVGKVENAVQYDSAAHDKVTLGGTDASAAVKLTNLADGDISSASSTDAVTGGQLYATNENVAALTQAVQNIGDTSSPYVAVNSTSGPASASGSNSIAMGGGANASGASSTAIGDKASAAGENSVALGANSVADQANTVSVGSAGNERRITNVADGVAGTDAVNMRQFQSGMTEMQRNAYGGIAAATALTMIPDVDQGKTIAVGIGTANYKGYQATALGVSARITQNVKVKMGAGYSAGGDTTWGGGMSYQW